MVGRLTTLYNTRPWWLKERGKKREEEEGEEEEGKVSEEAHVGVELKKTKEI